MRHFSSLWLATTLAAISGYAQADYFSDTLTKALHYHAVKTDNSIDFDEQTLKNTFLVEPESIYSDTVSNPPILNSIGWASAVGDFNRDQGTAFDPEETLGIFLRETGLTKARPHSDIAVDRVPEGYVSFERDDPLILANVLKAGVDADLYYHAYELFGWRYGTIAAKFALAAQYLRDSMNAIPLAQHRANGIDAGVLTRFKAAQSYTQLSHGDQNYLMGILDYQLRSPDYRDGQGGFHLPPQYRLARLAAAYRYRNGFISSTPICTADGRYSGTDGAEPCLNDMTDKALFDWYKEKYRDQMKPRSPEEPQSSFLSKLLEVIVPIATLFDGLALFESFEAAEAGELGAEGAFSEEEAEGISAASLSKICRI
ncbi:hypothetical protein AB1K01_19825 [Pseudomonas paraeruginosa]|uniref:hypothetical protein n=1 Tax=Pseudomonas paraeruginosa TaxID=2994495 RepID=UPI003D2E33F6